MRNCFCLLLSLVTFLCLGDAFPSHEIVNDLVGKIDWKKLVDEGIDRVDPETKLTPLQLASKFDSIKVARECIKHGANINLAHSKTLETPLMYATRAGSVRVLKYFLGEAGANPTLRDDGGRTALHIGALGNSNANVVDIILDGITDDKFLVNIQDRRENTALHHATYYGSDIGYVENLVQHGADVNIPDANGNTALHFSAGKAKDKETALLLLAGSDPSQRNAAGETAYDIVSDLKKSLQKGKNENQSIVSMKSLNAVSRLLLNWNGKPKEYTTTVIIKSKKLTKIKGREPGGTYCNNPELYGANDVLF